jgi:FkbM family methyltransferase
MRADIAVKLTAGKLTLPARDALVFQLDELDFEFGDRQLVRRVLRPGDVFIDVGSHAGLYALEASGSGAHIVAVEPNPAMVEYLRRNVEGLDVEVVHAAASDRPGTARLRVPSVEAAVRATLAEGQGIAVETVTLDMLSQPQTPFLIKIDAEGWESRVLDGGYVTLGAPSAPHLIVELSDRTAAQAGKEGVDVYRKLSDLGYHLYRYSWRRNSLEPEPPRQSYTMLNVVATKRPGEIAARLRASERTS